ncbi:MAG: lipid-A-disaccharide synthase [Bacteroidales bacterium]|jgi:lipid-A-disaccharide synthase|nr:lipid-A-disaccharide synthase [Bacteroidales bacterium]
MNYYIIAGELSGDLHASYLIREIRKRDKLAFFRGFGGYGMAREGCHITKHINELAFMGFIEVIANLKTVLGNIKACKEDILDFNPDCIISVDYPGFNLRIAKFAKRHHIKVFHYISPSVWAWKKGRIKQMKRILYRLYVILPFEKEFYAKHNMEVEYFGSPLLDEIRDFRATNAANAEPEDYWDTPKPVIVLMPGSRTQEIRRMLPLQLQLADNYPQYEFVIAGVPTHGKEFYDSFIGIRNVEVRFNQTYSLLNIAQAAVVTSGTATLETALFGVPQVVCYKANAISFLIGRFVANVKFISLVNLILNRKAVVELLQKDCDYGNLDYEFRKITLDNQYITKLKGDYDEIKQLLGNAGASSAIAEDIYKNLNA